MDKYEIARQLREAGAGESFITEFLGYAVRRKKVDEDEYIAQLRSRGIGEAEDGARLRRRAEGAERNANATRVVLAMLGAARVNGEQA